MLQRQAKAQLLAGSESALPDMEWDGMLSAYLDNSQCASRHFVTTKVYRWKTFWQVLEIQTLKQENRDTLLQGEVMGAPS